VFAKPVTIDNPTDPTENTTLVENPASVNNVYVDVYGDIFIAPEEGFTFDNLKDNKHELSFSVVHNTEVLYESDYIKPGENAKWDTSKMDEGFYDCSVIVSVKNEDGDKCNSFSLHQIFYIDAGIELDTNKLFTVSIPETVLVASKEGVLSHEDFIVTVTKNTNEDGSPLPRTENITVSAVGHQIEEMMIDVKFENVSAEGEEIKNTFVLSFECMNGQLEDGDCEFVTTFHFDGYTEGSMLK
jgi:hypothetical protein